MAGERSNFEKYDLKNKIGGHRKLWGLNSATSHMQPLIASRIQKNRSFVSFKCL